MAENIEIFIEKIAESLRRQTFVKLTLGNYKGADEHLQKLLARLIETKKGTRLFLLYRYDTRDTAKNHDFDEGLKIIRRLLGTEFFSGHLFTTENNFQIDVGNKGKARLNTGKPTFKQKPSLVHDRPKTQNISPQAFYLHALGVTTEKGEVRDKQQDKWRQINKFVETLAKLFENSALRERKRLKIVDMGSGKGYLTFAAYDYFQNARGIETEMIGVDRREELVSLCNDIARSCEFENLKFVSGSIDTFALPETDILIALHACNTATDEAIFQGIKADAALIVCSPCCHQEIRPQIAPPDFAQDILKHGTLLERQAEILTDGLRAMLLESSGYNARVFEFIPTEHTPKNNLLVGARRENSKSAAEINTRIRELMNLYGIKTQRLHELLESRESNTVNRSEHG